jgi:hypothetical protein
MNDMSSAYGENARICAGLADKICDAAQEMGLDSYVAKAHSSASHYVYVGRLEDEELAFKVRCSDHPTRDNSSHVSLELSDSSEPAIIAIREHFFSHSETPTLSCMR